MMDDEPSSYGQEPISLWADDSSSLARTIFFNSTNAGVIVLAGAGVVITALALLYLYDYFFTPAASSKTEYYDPNNDPNYPYYQPPQARRY